MKNLLKKKIFNNKILLAILASDLISNFGDILYYLALLNYALLVPRTELALAIITASESLPIFLSVISGSWSDRTEDKLKGIRLTMLFRAFLYIILTIFIGFEPSLCLVVLAAVINFFSDMAGRYENGLFMPIHMRLVENKDRAEFFGLWQSIKMLSIIVFEFIAAALVAYFTYPILAGINAVSFLLALIILSFVGHDIEKLFVDKPVKIANKSQENIFKSTGESMRMAVKELFSIKDLKAILFIAPLLNAIASVIIVLMTLSMKNNPSLVIKNTATSLALVQVVIIAGNIIGGLLCMNLLKEVSVRHTMVLSSIFLLLIMIFLYFQLIYSFLFFLFLLGIFAGALNPKLNAVIFNSVSEERMATISLGIGSYFQAGVFLTRLILSGLIIWVRFETITIIFVIISLIVFLYTIFDYARVKKVNEDEG